jgi:signal transduction histidine kinase
MVAAIGSWSTAVAFCFVAVASAGGRLPRPAAVAVLVGVAAALGLLLERQTGLLGLSVVVLLLVMALVAGIGRRESALLAEQRELALAAATRAQEEHIRAAALAERARIARDVHDALAHSLSALAVQLQGARLMVLRDGAPPDTLAQIERAQRLATDGLAEARRAVSALRADPVALAAGLRALVDTYPRAELELDIERVGEDGVRAGAGAGAEAGGEDRAGAGAEGGVEEMTPADRETVLRVAQEALSNARKHAPDAPVLVTLRREVAAVELTVRDRPGTPPAGPRADGYGLLGMAERAALIGAECCAGPTEDGWQVRLRIPRRAVH